MKRLILGLLLCVGSLTVTATASAQYGGGIGLQGCQADMIARNGTVIQSFTANNCQRAVNQCQVELQRRQSQGMNPYAVCQSRGNNGHNPNFPQNPGRPDLGNGRGEWVQIDLITYRDSKTAVAIANCKAARTTDIRCSRLQDHQCSACTEIAHSDESTYTVYQFLRGGGGGYQPNPPSVRREFIQTLHFTDKKTAIAQQKCNQYRSSLPQCSQIRQYECTPCTIESHTDHSQFDLYRLVRY